MQTYARVGEPLSSTRTRCRFGSQRRFEATIECERWLPNDGFFPQMAQIFDIAGGIVATRRGVLPAAYCLLLGAGSEPREQVGHLQRGAHRVGRLRDARLGLLDRVDREHAEGDRDARLDPGEL